MKALTAPDTEGESLYCYACGREIRDGKWFARLQHGAGRIVFCRPWCVEVFLETPEKRTGGLAARPPEGR